MAVTAPTRQSLGERTLWTGGAGSDGAGGEIILDTDDGSLGAGDVSKYDYFTLKSATGVFEVTASMDGNSWSAPLGMVNLCSTSTAPVLASVANNLMAFSGCFKHIRVTTVGGAVTDLQVSAGKL